MTLRIFAAIALLLGAAAFTGYLNLIGRGPFVSPALRHLRRMKDRSAAPDSVTPVGLPDLQALPRGVSLAAYAPIERRGVSIDGFVQEIVRAMDDDVHLEVVTAARSDTSRDTAYVTGEITPFWRRHSQRWSYEGLASAFRVNHGSPTAWDGGPRRVRLSGWLMYDFQNESNPTFGQLTWSSPRITGWEIHPVTRIELWDDAIHGFVDYPR